MVPEVVDEVLQEVHLPGRHIVEADGSVAAAAQPRLLLVHLRIEIGELDWTIKPQWRQSGHSPCFLAMVKW